MWLGGWVYVTCRYCIKMAKPILKLFRPSGSPIILVSTDPAPIPNSKGNPFSGVLNIQMVGKIGDFHVIFDDGYYGTSIGSHVCRIEWYNFR